ncbi:MAG: BrnT family toxin [Terracidiphilus sp.]
MSHSAGIQRIWMPAPQIANVSVFFEHALDKGIYNVYTLVEMDLYFLYHGQRFVWDSEKASINVRKHGVSFEVACQVFFDPFIRVEDASADEEQRDTAIGLTEDWTLLFVIHILREGDTIRINFSTASDYAGTEVL